ncbi:MAG: ribosome biosis GTPase / thiamine phosphate phosphatase [Solirubrobacteraceae bacterium]|nr:ribosome biosis GTPase / thiamine phosphate phosphatase [Solirubrobacteraceae bacterium]
MQVAPGGVGRRPDLDAELDQLGDPNLTAARVLAQHRGRWLVAPAAGGPPALVAARGRLRAPGERSPTTGDWVALDADGVIAFVLERRGVVVRRAAGAPVAGQVLAANVELVLVVEPLPEPNERRIERIVALARAGDVSAALVLTKSDLDPEGAAAATALASRLGLPDGVAVSVQDEASVAVVTAMLEPGSTTVLLGPSGAGKSTLVNALLGYERQAIGAVSDADGRGRHTTVTRDLLTLPNGALLIDTPGIREAGLWEAGGLSATFADIETLAARCRFSDCSHEDEPGCAVRELGDPERLAAWRKLEREQTWIEDRRAASVAREQLGRSYKRAQRASRRAKGGR